MEEIWVKIGLPGSDPQLGTLQGRICRESFTSGTPEGNLPDLVNKAITDRSPIKLFDPLIFRTQRDQQGNILLGALNLAESMPTIEERALYLNPANILWWAKLEDTESWQNVVASAIHHIEIAGSDIPNPATEVKKSGPRVVK